MTEVGNVSVAEVAPAGTLGLVAARTPLVRRSQRMTRPSALVQVKVTRTLAGLTNSWPLVGAENRTVGGTLPGGTTTVMATGAEVAMAPAGRDGAGHEAVLAGEQVGREGGERVGRC